jgi:2'-5' RNA ligase
MMLKFTELLKKLRKEKKRERKDKRSEEKERNFGFHMTRLLLLTKLTMGPKMYVLTVG